MLEWLDRLLLKIRPVTEMVIRQALILPTCQETVQQVAVTLDNFFPRQK